MRRLVERDAELAAIDGALRAAIGGDGHVLAIRGTAGAGKTSLLRELAERARAQGMRVLGATAGRLESDYPFGVTRQLLEREVVNTAPDVRERLLAGPARLGAQALAEHDRNPIVADPGSGLVHGLYWLIANLAADGPLLLCVDDVQWCDLASLHFLVYLARRVADLPVLVAVATRRDQHQGDQQAFTTLVETVPRTALVPQPLSGDGVQAMLDAADAHVPAETATRLRAETGGNPFLVGELARALADGAVWADGPLPAPETVARSIQSRVSAAGPDAVRLAAAVAALGDGCAPAEAAAVAGLDPDTSIAVLSELLRAGVLALDVVDRVNNTDSTHSGVGFAHPLVRTAIEDGMTAPERSNWHAVAAGVLTERGVDHERVAVQLMNCDPAGDPRVSALLADAGRHALGKGAPVAASHYLQRALDEGPAPEDLGAVLTDLGTSLLVSNRFADAAGVLRLARERSTDDSELLARTVTLWLALTAVGADAVAEGVALLDSTIERLQDREARLMLESEFVNVAFLDPGRLQDTWRRLEPFAGLSGATPAERRLLSVTTIKSQYTASDSAEVVADAALRAYGDGKLIDENPLDPTKWFWAIGSLLLTDHLDEAEAALQRGAVSAAATGSLDTLLVVEDLRGLLWLRRGRTADTVSEAGEALERLGDRHRTPVVRSLEIALVRWSLLAMTARGQLTDADRLLERHGLAGDLPLGARQVRLHHERGQLRLAQRRPKDALDEARQLADFHETYGIESVVEAPWRVVAARALAALGETDDAISMAEENLVFARRWGLARDVGVALRTRAQVEPDLERRVDLLASALATLRAAPAPLELAGVATELGASLRRTGRRDDARIALADALTLSTNCDATAVTAWATEEMQLVGGRTRVRAVSGVGSLTPGERRIARLAADGLSNRQIAQELFLSVRTAENTLRRVYQKLDIASRRELAGAMADAASP